jgi:hypothetical protein
MNKRQRKKFLKNLFKIAIRESIKSMCKDWRDAIRKMYDEQPLYVDKDGVVRLKPYLTP